MATAIIGARLGESEHRDDNLKIFGFALDVEDRAGSMQPLRRRTRIPGDCGDEYRKPPYLTASGDLSHHLDAIPSVFKAGRCRPAGRCAVSSGSVGADRRLPPRGAGQGHDPRLRPHHGDRMAVTCCVAPGDPAAQRPLSYILDKIAASISARSAGRSRMSSGRASILGTPQMGACFRAPRRVFMGHARRT